MFRLSRVGGFFLYSRDSKFTIFQLRIKKLFNLCSSVSVFACLVTVTYMKRLAFRSTFLSSYKNFRYWLRCSITPCLPNVLYTMLCVRFYFFNSIIILIFLSFESIISSFTIVSVLMPIIFTKSTSSSLIYKR